MKRSTLLVSGLLALTACSQQHSDLQEWITTTQQEAKSKVQPFEQPTVNPMVTYIPPKTMELNAFNAKRLNNGPSGVNAPNTNRPKEILENYSLEALKYVGSFSKGNQTSAFVEADGHVYTVKIGNYIGLNFGRISAITPDSLKLTEVIEDTYGNWTYRNTELQLNNTEYKSDVGSTPNSASNNNSTNSSNN